MCSSCRVKDVQSNSYTTTDGLVITNVAFINTFTVTCDSGRSDHLSLFAEVPSIGKSVPVVRSADGASYQVSWVEELKQASSGDRDVKVYDEEGYSALRKAQRRAEETRSTPETVNPILTLTINHGGTYRGPWINAEVIAIVAVLSVWYLAYSAKSKLTS